MAKQLLSSKLKVTGSLLFHFFFPLTSGVIQKLIFSEKNYSSHGKDKTPNILIWVYWSTCIEKVALIGYLCHILCGTSSGSSIATLCIQEKVGKVKK